MNRRLFLLYSLFFFPALSSAKGLKLLSNINFNVNNKKAYFASFFDTGENNAVVISCSLNGIDWSRPKKIFYNGHPILERDPCLRYIAGTWVLAVTSAKQDLCDFKVYTSKDLHSWDVSYIKMDGSQTIFNNSRSWGGGNLPSNQVWAPNLMSDESGNNYVFISIKEAYDKNFPKSKELFFGVYVSKFSFEPTLSSSVPTRVQLIFKGKPDPFSRIDPCVVFDSKRGLYILAAKRENVGCIDFFSSTSVHGPYNYLSTLDFYKVYGYIHIEGPALINIDGLWYVFFDSYYDGTGIGYCTTSDFKEFSKPIFSFFGSHIRHGSLSSSDNNSALSDLRNFFN